MYSYIHISDNAKLKGKSQEIKHVVAAPGMCNLIKFIYIFNIWIHNYVHIISGLSGLVSHPGVEVPESQEYHPEELNKKALAIIERVRQKLTGKFIQPFIHPILQFLFIVHPSVHHLFAHPSICLLISYRASFPAGNDFHHEKMINVERQVQLLIEQASSHENLCQCYIGWCPFW